MSRTSGMALLLAACCLASPGCYLVHATGGQLSILWGRVPIEEVIEEGAVDAVAIAKLRLVLDVRRFASEVIGLEVSGSYECFYDTEGDPIAWNVSASAPDALAPYGWWFPIVGTLPYIGFFEQEPASELAGQLRSDGLDALVLPVPAYSTLGWFDDPFYSSLLDYEESRIAGIVIHELAHATVWIDSDADFNENLATFVEVEGAKAYFLARGGAEDPGLAQARTDAKDSEVFADAIGRLRGELGRIYESSGPRSVKLELKRAAFKRFRERFAKEVKPELSDDGYDYVLDERIELNNAFVLALHRYHGELDSFYALLELHEGGLKATVEELRQLADAEDPRAALEARVGVYRK